MSPTQFLGVAAATVLLILVPGPSVMFIVGQALARGRGAALLSAGGNATGALIAGLLIALGLGVLVTESTLVVEIMRYLGAGVLVILGVTAIATAGRTVRPRAAAPSRAAGDRPGIRSFLAAVVVGATNPKVYIIFAALLPTFVDPSSSVPAGTQMVLLAAVPVVIGLLSDAAWAVGASWARTSIVNAPSRMRLFQRIGGGCLVAVGGFTALHRS
ncbi:putative threonine efflux protein [Microbacterium testaceum StLB037]|uniref:Threonine efflux protein n=1 Tax=Microbacterium testaceum (strain StLB037) TaxID=979556 RepID=E8N744_MICTS|nr:LysE family translocator [Microbacterium testaceum]BAJ74261.1 putative threonine efflux protein [Microbacterium testaceum StLB037]